MASTMRTVVLPEDLCRVAETRFAHRFESLDELITAVLKELVSEHALVMDENEQRVIEERLRGLGYI